eukprot:s1479_g17.t2
MAAAVDAFVPKVATVKIMVKAKQKNQSCPVSTSNGWDDGNAPASVTRSQCMWPGREVRLDPLLTERMQLEDEAESKDQELLEEGPSTSPETYAFEVDDGQENQEDSPHAIPWQRFAVKAVVTLIGFLIIAVLLEIYAKAGVTRFSKQLMDSIGLPGLFIAVLLGDGLPQPFPYVPLIFIAVKAQVPKVQVFGICALGSYLAALGGYGVGFSLSKVSCYQQGLQRLSESQPWLPDLMHRKGAMGVAIAALMPVPLALATWTAGSFRVNFFQFLLSAGCRMPKILVFVILSDPKPF